MSIGRHVDKEVMVHVYNKMLLSSKIEHIWVSSSEVDEPRTCYTKWSKSEKQISCFNAYIWNLEKWYCCTCLQDRNRNMETDIENRLLTQRDGRRGWEELREDTFYHLLLYLWRLWIEMDESSLQSISCSYCTYSLCYIQVQFHIVSLVCNARNSILSPPRLLPRDTWGIPSICMIFWISWF